MNPKDNTQDSPIEFYAVWFCGDNDYPEGICYEGRCPAIYNSFSAAVNKRSEMQVSYPDAVYKLVKITEV